MQKNRYITGSLDDTCTLNVITASLRIGRYFKVIENIVKEIPDKLHIANLMSIPHMADLVIDMVDDAIYEGICNPETLSRLPVCRGYNYVTGPSPLIISAR